MAQMQKLISVIIPVYRAEKTLERTVESVLRQTYPEIEIILIDDGSPDQSGKLCDKLAEGHDRIRTIHMDDRGVSAARNAGLKAAQGERITFLDADDAMEPNMLAVLSEIMEQTGADIVGAAFKRISAAQVQQDRSREKAGESDTDIDAGLDGTASGNVKILRGTDIIPEAVLKGDTRVWSKLFRRDIALENTFEEGLTIGEDMLYFLKMIGKETVYAATDQPLFVYTINPSGAMERPFTASYMDQLRCWKLAQEYIREKYPDLYQNETVREQLAKQQAVYAVLTAGKISRLPAAQRAGFTEQYDECVRLLRAQIKNKGCFSALSTGYKIKAVFLQLFPKTYRLIYGRLTGR